MLHTVLFVEKMERKLSFIILSPMFETNHPVFIVFMHTPRTFTTPYFNAVSLVSDSLHLFTLFPHDTNIMGRYDTLVRQAVNYYATTIGMCISTDNM